MTEATLNANNIVDVFLIPLKCHMWMYDKMTNMYTLKQWSMSSFCARGAVLNVLKEPRMYNYVMEKVQTISYSQETHWSFLVHGSHLKQKKFVGTKSLGTTPT